jgi:hypothetical protein
MLAVLVVSIFVMQPLYELGVADRTAMSVVFSLLLVSGAWTVARTRVAVIAGVLMLAGLGVRWLRIGLGTASLAAPSALLANVFCIVVAAAVLSQVFRTGRITVHRIQGAIAAYLLLGMAWAFAYEVVALERPGAFAFASGDTRLDGDPISHFVYFSFVTLTTVGYGDVTAIHPIARSLVTVEALVGQLFPAILLARLVSMELSHQAPNGRAE